MASGGATSANLFEVALLVGALLGVLVVDDVQRRLPLLQLQALDLRLQLVELLLQVLALLHVLHPGGDRGEGYKGSHNMGFLAQQTSERFRRVLWYGKHSSGPLANLLFVCTLTFIFKSLITLLLHHKEPGD